MFNVRQRLDAQWQRARQQLIFVLLCAAVPWAVWLVNLALPGPLFDPANQGIAPRTFTGLLFIPLAPLVHQSIGPLLANTLAFTVAGWLTLMSGRAQFFMVCITAALAGGLGAWAFGSSSMVHSGSGSVMFGLLGFLLARGWLARRVLWAMTAFAVCILYVGVLLSLISQERVSWASDFWGLLGGAGFAWWKFGRKPHSAAPLPGPGKQ